MDTSTLIGILTSIGILGGSLGTIIITKIIDYFSEKRIFKRELRRQFFAKKLEASEKATKFYISSNNYYKMLQTSFDLFISDGDKAYASALLSEAIDKCKSLWDISSEQISLMSLYFDPKPITWYPVDNESKTINYISELLKRDTKTGIIERKQMLAELNKCIEFEKRKNAYYAKIIRDELKKYDM